MQVDPRLTPWATIVKPLLAAFFNLRCRHQTTACRQSERDYHNPTTASAVAKFAANSGFFIWRCRNQATHDDIAYRHSERNYHNPATANAVAKFAADSGKIIVA